MYIWTFWNKDTSIQGQLTVDPVVSLLERLHCSEELVSPGIRYTEIPLYTVYALQSSHCFIFADWKSSEKFYLDWALEQWPNMAVHDYKNANLTKISDLQKFHHAKFTMYMIYRMVCVVLTSWLDFYIIRHCKHVIKNIIPKTCSFSQPFTYYPIQWNSSSLIPTPQ